MKNKIISGMFWHCHHDRLCEYVYDYQERVDYIKKEKPENEIKTRLRLFRKIKGELPGEFIEACKKLEEAYKKWREAGKKWREAYKKYDEADKKWVEVCKKHREAYEKYVEAYKKYDEADKKWREADEKLEEAGKKFRPELEALHKKECGCKEWDGNKLVFEEAGEK